MHTPARARADQPGETGPWRFVVSPPGRRFGWKGRVYASHRVTGLLETEDAVFAATLRELAKRDRIEEVR